MRRDSNPAPSMGRQRRYFAPILLAAFAGCGSTAPASDAEQLVTLRRKIDEAHENIIGPESASPRSDPRMYRTYQHSHRTLDLTGYELAKRTYHRDCSICDENYNTRLAMDEIMERQNRDELAALKARPVNVPDPKADEKAQALEEALDEFNDAEKRLERFHLDAVKSEHADPQLRKPAKQYRRRTFYYKAEPDLQFFHKGCDKCDANFRAFEAMEAVHQAKLKK